MLQTSTEIYAFNGFRLNVGERLLLYHDQPVQIPEKAFGTLRVLVQNAGRLVTKDKLLSDVWGGSFVEENNLDKSVSTLRRTLGSREADTKFIETVRGHGYRFVVDVERVEAAKSEVSERLPGLRPAELTTGTPAHFAPSRGAGNIVSLAQWRLEPHDHDEGKEDIPEPQADHRHEWLRGRWFAVGSAAIGLAVLVGLSALYFLPARQSVGNASDGTPFASFTIKRFSDNGSFNPAVISPDGKFIAYTDKNFAVWLKNAATDSNVKILPESGERSMIGFSPDDNYLYFHHTPKDRKREILKIPVFGGPPPQKIAEETWSHPSLSPDGAEVAFTRFDSGTGVFSLIAAKTDGTGERVIAKSRENERFDSWLQGAAWSPDGKRIACVGREERDEIVYRFISVFDADDGTEISRIRPHTALGAFRAIVWLPDGDHLLTIVSDFSNAGQIYRYAFSNNTWRRVTNDLSEYWNLSVSADGSLVLTARFENQSNLWVMDREELAAGARQITFGFNSIDDAAGLSWTREGRIVYATNTTGRWEIWMIGADGSGQKQLTQNCAGNDTCAMPFVSPDGRYIVFQASLNGEHNIWRMDIDGGNPIRLTAKGGILPFVTADGRSVIYVRKTVSSSTLRQVSIDGGESSLVSNISPIFLGNSSPDGRLLAFVHFDKATDRIFQTCVARLESDKPEKCFGKSRAFPSWTADNKAFYYLEHGYTGIWKQPLNGERELVLEFPGERVNTFAFSPDGRSLAVARSKPTQDIVAFVDER